MKLDYDYIICGGGISGLLLCVKLTQNTKLSNKSVLLIDPIFPKTENDRTLCFWDSKNTTWDEIIKCKWDNVFFKSNDYKKTLDLGSLDYKMLSSSEFYNYSNSLINTNDCIEVLNADVLNFNDYKTHCTVDTLNNSFTCSKVFNSIMDWAEVRTNTKYPLLIQHFEGWVIKTDNECFNPNKATFMDFSIEQNDLTQFMYVLPFSKTEALVEYTLFSKDLLEPQKYEDAIKKYLNSSRISDYKVTSKESGKIPMTCFPFFKNNSKNILNIGSAGGWSKPSTGYTFKNIDNNTTRIADYLQTGKSFKNFMTKDRFWFYDLIFLDVLYKENDLGKKLFTDMFKKNNSKTIFKFLDNKSNFIEEFKIMLSFPKSIFLTAVLKRLFKGL